MRPPLKPSHFKHQTGAIDQLSGIFLAARLELIYTPADALDLFPVENDCSVANHAFILPSVVAVAPSHS